MTTTLSNLNFIRYKRGIQTSDLCLASFSDRSSHVKIMTVDATARRIPTTCHFGVGIMHYILMNLLARETPGRVGVVAAVGLDHRHELRTLLTIRPKASYQCLFPKHFLFALLC